MRKPLILISIAILLANCESGIKTDQESDSGYLMESFESVFAENGVKPLLENELLGIITEESFGGWPVYMIFLCPEGDEKIIFVVGSAFYMRTGIIGAFVYEDTFFSFYKCSEVNDDFSEAIDLTALGNVSENVYRYFGGDPEAALFPFHETFHKFILFGDSLIFVEKRRLKDEIPIYNFHDVRSAFF